jgi:hypothetical protein
MGTIGYPELLAAAPLVCGVGLLLVVVGVVYLLRRRR